MTTWLLVLVGLALLLVVAVAFTRRALARERRRVDALERFAERLELSLAGVRPPTLPSFEQASGAQEGATPLVADRLPGRAALLEAVAAEVERARAGPTRLTIVLVRAAGATTAETLVEAVREVTGRHAYAVGPNAVAFTLPGLGRADGLGTVARIESMTQADGNAAEWSPGETPAELVTRLLAEPHTAA